MAQRRRQIVTSNQVPRDVPGLWQEVVRLSEVFGDGAMIELIEGVTISSAGATVAHGLRTTPRAVYAFPRSELAGPPFRAAAADSKNVYLQAPRGSFTNSFTGRNGAGACTCVGLDVGDTVEFIYAVGPTLGITGPPSAGEFQTTITVADQIQQLTALNLSTVHYVVTVRQAAEAVCDLLVVP